MKPSDEILKQYIDAGALAVRADGRVLRVKKRIGNRYRQLWHFAACVAELADVSKSSNGYRRVFVADHGARHYVAAHRVVTAIVTGDVIDDGLVVRHRDSDRTNNRPGNLEVCSPRINQLYINFNATCHADDDLDSRETTAFFIKRSIEARGVESVVEITGIDREIVEAIASGELFPNL